MVKEFLREVTDTGLYFMNGNFFESQYLPLAYAFQGNTSMLGKSSLLAHLFCKPAFNICSPYLNYLIFSLAKTPYCDSNIPLQIAYISEPLLIPHRGTSFISCHTQMPHTYTQPLGFPHRRRILI